MKLPGLDIFRIQGGWAFVCNVRDDDGEPVRVLRVGGVYQSATYLGERRFELPFEYYRATMRVLDEAVAQSSDPATAPGGGAVPSGLARTTRVLAIGGGGCSVPKHLAACRNDVAVDVVERDATIANIARKLFFADEAEATGRMRLVVDDGLAFLGKPGARYFAILNDAFVGEEPAWDLLEGDALALAKSRLEAGGILLVNAVCPQTDEGAACLSRIVDSLKRHFACVSAVFATDESMSDKDNFIVVASDEAYEFAGSMEF